MAEPSPADSASSVDVIIPPPDIKQIVDKMAQSVAKSGERFEKKVWESMSDNPKFGFIQSSNPYHAYYRQQVDLCRTKPSAETEKIAEKTEDEQMEDIESTKAAGQEQQVDQRKKITQERQTFLDHLRSGTSLPSAPPTNAETPPERPPRYQFMTDIPFDQVSSMDLEIIKLAAQFVAKNGAQFRTGLAAREQNNPQFDFLKVGHPAHHLFNGLVESYSAVLRPPRDIITQLYESKAKSVTLEKILKRVEWERYQIQIQERDREDIERKEREARQQIDWHSFVVVETITFHESEQLAAPRDFSQEGQADPDQKDDSDADMDMDMDMDMDVEASETPASNLQVKKDYRPTFPGAQKRTMYQKCPVCSQDIPVDDLDEHVRIELLDPRFAKQRETLAKRQNASSLASGSDIVSGLKSLQPHRSDIFGDYEDLEIGKTEAPHPDKVIWDGHSSSAGRATAALSLQQQIAQIENRNPTPVESYEPRTAGPEAPSYGGEPEPHSIREEEHDRRPLPPGQSGPPGGLPPPSFPTRPPGGMGAPPGAGMSLPPPPFPSARPPAPVGEPPAKKQRLESNFVPEGEWIAAHPNPITLKVNVPQQENKNGWALDGQILEFQMSVGQKVLELKEQITTALQGIPANKQNLKVEGLPFLKDKDSLASYNLSSGVEIHLGVKERGKRKK